MNIDKFSKIKYTLNKITADEGQSGTTLDADVTAEAHNEFTWDIDKSVTPTELNLCNGDSGTAHYTVSVVKSSSNSEFISGIVTVTNGGDVATVGLEISVKLTEPSGSPTVAGPVSVDVSSNPVLDSDETENYAYIIPISASLNPGTYKVIADVTILNHSGHITDPPTPFGPSPSSDGITLPSALDNNTIHVTDDNHIVHQEFTDSGAVSYDIQYKCPDNTSINDNIAVIDETGQSASASVTVNCKDCRVRGLIIKGIINNIK